MEGGADIIDVKNPKEGSLGAGFPWIVREVKNLTPDEIEVSAAIGDMPDLPATASLAALGAVYSGADYVKVGLKGVRSKRRGIYLMKRVVRAVHSFDDSTPVVGAGYGDARRIDSVLPHRIPEIVQESGGKIAMLDTIMKGGMKLFDFLSFNELNEFVESAHRRDLLAALAGSLEAEDIQKVGELGADVVGFRGAACSRKDRMHGQIQREKVEKIVEAAKAVRK